MEKVKVKDLASEFQVENKEVRELLTSNGFDVKNANSNVDEEGVKLVRGFYAGKNKSASESVNEKTVEKAEQPAKDATAKVADTGKEEPVKPETPAKESAAEVKKEAPKKKKVIIVNNTQSNKNSDFQKNKQNMNNRSGNNSGNNSGNRQTNGVKEPNPFRPMIPKPVVKPVVIV